MFSKACMSAPVCLLVAILVRFGLMLYGEWQDRTMLVKYTDVDYYVFTDAARHIIEGRSPYDRATYRYTPFLAILLTPNIYLTVFFGKLIFILCDVLTGWLLYKILQAQGVDGQKALWFSLLWLFNPLPMTVSSRGNAESIMTTLVLSTIYTLMKKQYVLSSILYAVSVHVKIYPVTYALPIYLLLNRDYLQKKTARKDQRRRTDFYELIIPNAARITYFVIAGSVFVALTGVCYFWYGNKFLYETYLYHITRRDIRHNFSVYFYMLYLLEESSYSFYLGLGVFLPQMLLLLLVSWKMYHNLPLCCFVHTFVFVTFNKVVTSQYFLWYGSLLPLVIPHLTMKKTTGAGLVIAWFAGQALWLTPAYYLEFQGVPTFLYIWLAGLVFFTVNIVILQQIILANKRTNDQLEYYKPD
ncbi:GPI mannosyltransferase 1 [Lingula anatina]|uniref:GPI alpha-1,4-mannosyltransferase I, catalytic subunit n=1 Tax=Lingula anatina TaxID=7574 RepID=A0A1S3KH29_LINAN|nr:GPI mannosyltransferase 1 [Lingula anatina]XP_013421924.1 GPI mannosyltransferase 1 [Lingula anatina]XP_013421934.1 GPI mannosyltransferase 1 [Lingula anatina]XP_013421943.1 GPI mannosyltransferase 1 [Lingula anatina]|eukprot:XP_013421914.1 GPI mannosyltransferase 1 [Lingula anatina]